MAHFEFNWALSSAAYQENMEKWWRGLEFDSDWFGDSDSGLVTWLADWVSRYRIGAWEGDCIPADSPWSECVSYGQLFRAMSLLDPRVSRLKGADQIIVYESAQKRQRGIRLALNPGKAIRRIIPGLPDRYLEKAVDEFKVKFDSASYEIKWGETREDFKFAYLSRNYSPTENIRFTGFRKSMANSCMRHDFDFRGLHPTEAYASGDFRILTAIRKDSGKVSARCIVRVTDGGEFHHAPIYGTSDNAMDLLEAELGRLNAREADSFHGARMLKIPCQYGILSPYLDIGPERILKPDSEDETVTLDNRGTILFGSSTCGYSRFKNRACCECGEECNSEYDYQVGDSWYCESCYSDNFTSCECCEETYNSDDLETVYDWDSYNECSVSRSVCSSCRHSHYTRVDGADYGQFWNDNCILETHDGDSISPRDAMRNYFTSEHSGELFPNNERVENENGEFISESEAEEMGLVDMGNGLWGNPTLETLATQFAEMIYDSECRAATQAYREGQTLLPWGTMSLGGLRRSCGVTLACELDFELPQMGGLNQWGIVESIALKENPQIQKVTVDGETWYQFPRPNSRFRDDMMEYPTLAECLAAIQSQGV